MLGNYYGESKREPGPIDPVESEIIEKVVMMQQQPTNEEVEKMKRRLARSGLDCVLPNEVESLADAYLALREEVEKERKERIKWQRIRKPTHGPCCTCQRCGQYHDDCRCDLDEVCDELDQLKAQNQALRARLGNNILEA